MIQLRGKNLNPGTWELVLFFLPQPLALSGLGSKLPCRFRCAVAFRDAWYRQWRVSHTKIQEQWPTRLPSSPWLGSHSWSQRQNYTAGLRDDQQRLSKHWGETSMSAYLLESIFILMKASNWSLCHPPFGVSRTVLPNSLRGIWPPPLSSEEGCERQCREGRVTIPGTLLWGCLSWIVNLQVYGFFGLGFLLLLLLLFIVVWLP